MHHQPTVGIAILTLNAEKHLSHCLKPLLASPLNPRILVVDSSSTDGTVSLAKRLGVETLEIDRKTFNHGATREWARKQLQTDIVLMITPDAYATDPHAITRLIQPIVKGQAAVSYGRQLAHIGADFFESFPRSFNYPRTSHIRSLQDASQYGIYTFFCSDSFAAYLNSALDSIGGFPTTNFGEDTLAVASLLKSGYKVAYVAEASVRHSHRYSLQQEFQRHLEIGYAREKHRDLLSCPGTDSQRGKEYARVLMRHLLRERPLLLPYACAHLGAKWLGYRLGRRRAARDVRGV